jgi:hypothetical protein
MRALQQRVNDKMGTRIKNSISLLDFLSVLAIILILGVILVSYSPINPNSVFAASPAPPGAAAACKPTPTNVCLLAPVLLTGTKIGYVFVWTTNSKPAWAAYEIKATPVTTGTRDQRKARRSLEFAPK